MIDQLTNKELRKLIRAHNDKIKGELIIKVTGKKKEELLSAIMKHPNKSYFVDNAHKFKEEKPAKKSKKKDEKKEEPKIVELPSM
tara:strand:+ start:39 stop:293 length:255 start_codon:yes stop_codon:yes gene_type:complete